MFCILCDVVWSYRFAKYGYGLPNKRIICSCKGGFVIFLISVSLQRTLHCKETSKTLVRTYKERHESAPINCRTINERQGLMEASFRGECGKALWSTMINKSQSCLRIVSRISFSINKSNTLISCINLLFMIP